MKTIVTTKSYARVVGLNLGQRAPGTYEFDGDVSTYFCSSSDSALKAVGALIVEVVDSVKAPEPVAEEAKPTEAMTEEVKPTDPIVVEDLPADEEVIDEVAAEEK